MNARLAAASLAIAALSASSFATAAAAAPGNLPPAAERTITVATYNIHHGAGVDGILDLERIAGVLEDTDADIIGLQEVDNHWGARSDFEDQAAWLAERLGMHACYSANLDLDPAADRTERRQYGTAILSGHRLRNCINTPLPNHPGGEQRGLAQADVKVRGVDLRFYNTHLTHNSAPGRAAQARVVNDIIAAGEADNPRREVVLVGDLNAVPTTPEYALFTERLGDVWTAVGEGPGYTIDPVNPDRRIDYILASDAVTPVSAEVIDTIASDHLPVVAEVILPHPGAVNSAR
ncbi:MAG: endonuclease/exonuclease/phosphatase family protein [Propionibacteriaceae bacterium]|nr:endonuclease/exonuclease/phosphatase family protein [Propionibacteriaceae bacterium]